MLQSLKQWFSKRHFEVTVRPNADWRMAHYYSGRVVAKRRFADFDAAQKWAVKKAQKLANRYAHVRRLDGFEWTIRPMTEHAKLVVAQRNHLDKASGQ